MTKRSLMSVTLLSLTAVIATFVTLTTLTPKTHAALFITVNSTADAFNAAAAPTCDVDLTTPGEQCTLRAALQVTRAVAGSDVIQFAIPGNAPNCTQSHCTIFLTQALALEIDHTVSITGPGADRLSIDGYSIFPDQGGVFKINLGSGGVTISGLTVQRGRARQGGGVYKVGAGVLTIRQCELRSNDASETGGAVFTESGQTNIIGTLIRDNEAEYRGGGVGQNTIGNTTIYNSTITRNRVVALTDPSFFSVGGGGVSVLGLMTIQNSTIIGNHARFGGGVWTVPGGAASLQSNIIAGNTSLSATPQLEGVFGSDGFNAIGVGSMLGQTEPTDFTNVTLAQLNLGPLGYNGGGSMTYAPLSGSIAIDKGFAPSDLFFDQRGSGFRRTNDDPAIPNAAGSEGTDIGAFEVQTDTDGDGTPDPFDPDDDNDGVLDENDAFPRDPNESVDTDSDGTGNNADTDDDNDGVLDVNDAFPLTPAESVDTDGDGMGNNADLDDDNDGVSDTPDNCPLVANPNQADFDLDGIGDTCDPLTGPPSSATQCSNGGWSRFNVPRTFTSQNDCLKWVRANVP